MPNATLFQFRPYKKMTGGVGIPEPETWDDIHGPFSNIPNGSIPVQKIYFTDGAGVHARLHDHSDPLENQNIKPVRIDTAGDITQTATIPSFKQIEGIGGKYTQLYRSGGNTYLMAQVVEGGGGTVNAQVIKVSNGVATGEHGVMEYGDASGGTKLRGSVEQMGEDTPSDGQVFTWSTDVTPNRWRPEAVPEVTYPSTNLARNGSFELAVTANVIRYWNKVDTLGTMLLTRVSGRYDNHGGSCIKLEHAIIDDGNYIWQNYGYLKPSTIYTVVLHCRANTHAPLQQVRIVTDNADTNIDYSQDCPNLYSDATSKIVKTFTTDVSGTDVQIKLGSTNDVAFFEIDSLSVTEGGEKTYEPDMEVINNIRSDGTADTLLKVGSDTYCEKTTLAEADVASAISLKHTQGTDQGLDTGGANAVVVADVKDAVTKKHPKDGDTNLGTLATKNPPIDADLMVLRDSASSFSLFTATCLQFYTYIKGKTDLLYQTLANIVTAWQGTPDNTHYPSEKLVKDNLDLKAVDADVVHDTGNETVAGIKTFSSFPITPSSAPTTDYQMPNKKYVDDNIPQVQVYQQFTASGGTNESFTLSTAYVTGTHTLFVYRNGKLISSAITETDTTHFTIPLTVAGDIIDTWIVTVLSGAGDMFKSVFDPAGVNGQLMGKSIYDPNGIGIPLSKHENLAGNTILIAADTSRGGATVGYTLRKEIYIPTNGTYRFTWQAKFSSGGGGGTAYSQIFRNGVAVGVEKTTGSTDWVDMSDDVAGWNAGDLAQLYTKSGSGILYSWVQLFKVKALGFYVNTD